MKIKIKDYYAKHTREYSWLIKEEGWVRSLQAVRETQFALGNGYLGSRAVLEELPYGARAGTYIAGLYDRVGSQVAELVNLPNPFNFKLVPDGEKLGLVTMDVLEHKRILNLRHGLLCRHSVFQDSRKRRYDYQSLRFLSLRDKNIGVLQVVFTPLDAPAEVSIQTGIDTAVYNVGTVTEGRKKHFRVRELGQFKNAGYLLLETFGKEHAVIFRSGFYYQTEGRKSLARDNIFELKLRKNQTVIFTKVFYVEAASPENNLSKLKRLSEQKFRRALGSSFATLLHRHIRAWEDLWEVAEVSIWGDPEVEKSFRFNIYHLLSCAGENNGASSIGAKALTGEGYRGHIFWDTEIFIFPFYLYTLPRVARNLLLYRYHRLDAARSRAREFGFKGALFPWESAGSGVEETPERAKDLDGRVIKIHTGKMEHHITADIAYAFYQYYLATGDEQFLWSCGYEVLLETARFWVSRVEFNKRKQKYEIKHVIGPDEFHEDVNNSAFTNMMAKWNLLITHRLFQRARKSSTVAYRRLAQRLELTAKEIKAWKNIAAGISIKVNQKQIIEQFDGYFRKRKIRISEWDENFLPVISKNLSSRKYGETMLIKQADVVMLLYLLSDIFTPKTKRQNYTYYVEKTIHKSSLSLPIYALMACEVGDRNRALRFFNTCLHTDISNVNVNTDEGVHIACMGGSWQALINGFAGLRIQREILSLNPRLPGTWRKILFSLHWRGSRLKLEVHNNRIKIQIIAHKKKKVRVKVFGALRELTAGKTYRFRRKRAAKKSPSYYL